MQEQLGSAGLGGRRPSDEAEESMKLLHRKAAALAWYRHGRRTSSAGWRASSRLQHSLSHVAAAANRSTLPQDPDPFTASGCYMAEEAGPDGESTPPNLLPVHQASRFKAEAQSRAAASLQPSLSVIDASSSRGSNKQIMSAGQSLALLSLLPQHQTQKLFQPKKDGGSSGGTPWDCGSSLYDSFELLCLSNQLGRCLTTVHAAAATNPPSSPHHKLLKNAPPTPTPTPFPPLPPAPFQVPPSYIPRSLYALPRFLLPNHLATKSSKKRSPLIHPIFSTPNTTPSASPPSLPPPPQTHHHNQRHPPDGEASKHQARRSGFQRVFNSLLKTFHMKPSPEPPKRSNLSDELKKLPAGRPRAPYPKDSPPPERLPGRPGEDAPPTIIQSRPPTSHHHHHHFRNEGFRTASKAPKAVKWAQPGSS